MPEVLKSYGYVEPITRASFLEACSDAYGWRSGANNVAVWSALHSRELTELGDHIEIDEDPVPARRGQPSPYSGDRQ